jgi:hypothetical protein
LINNRTQLIRGDCRQSKRLGRKWATVFSQSATRRIGRRDRGRRESIRGLIPTVPIDKPDNRQLRPCLVD